MEELSESEHEDKEDDEFQNVPFHDFILRNNATFLLRLVSAATQGMYIWHKIYQNLL